MAVPCRNRRSFRHVFLIALPRSKRRIEELPLRAKLIRGSLLLLELYIWFVPARMWQSSVEIEDYSVTYFDHIAAFEELYCRASVKGGTHMCFMDFIDVHAFRISSYFR